MNTTSTITPALQVYYDRNLLVRALPLLTLSKFGQRRPLKRASGNQIKFRRFGALPLATTPLTEGVTPAGRVGSVTDITATIALYGDYMIVTDVVSLVEQDPVLTEFGVMLGEQAGQTIEYLTWSALVAGTNVQYNNGAARNTLNTVITIGNVRKVVRTLKRANAKHITKMVDPSTNIGTLAVAPAFVAVVHPDSEPTIRGLSGFVSVENYGSGKAPMEGEIGSVNQVRFIVTTMARVFPDAGLAIGADGMISTSGVNNDVYATLFFAENAFGMTELEGGGITNIVKALGSGGSEDALNQRGSTGWKGFYVATILNDSFMVRLEHTNLTTPV